MLGSGVSAALMGVAVSTLTSFVASRLGQPPALAIGVAAGACLYPALACLFERREVDAWRSRLGGQARAASMILAGRCEPHPG